MGSTRCWHYASYLVNLASGDAELRVRSWRACRAELRRCQRLGIAGLVVHPGSCGDQPPSQALERGAPVALTLDNGTEFTSKHFDAWAYSEGIQLDFIRPGKPMENAFIESFNGRLRDECLKANLFLSIHDARQKLRAMRWSRSALRRLGGSTTIPNDPIAH